MLGYKIQCLNPSADNGNTKYHNYNKQNPAWYSENSSVSIVTRPPAAIPQNSGSIASRCKIFSRIPARLCYPSITLFNGLFTGRAVTLRMRGTIPPFSLWTFVIRTAVNSPPICFIWFSPHAQSLRYFPYSKSGLYSWDGECLLLGTDWVFIIVRSAQTLYLWVLCGSENKQRLFPYTTLTDWFV